MHKDRLVRLANLLRRDAANPNGAKFDLGTWGESLDAEPRLSCGTTACAMGLAAISGIFKDEGLTFWVHPEVDVNGEDINEIKIGYDGCYGYRAAAEFFGISGADARYLFAPDSYRGAIPVGKEGEERVAARIEVFIAENT